MEDNGADKTLHLTHLVPSCFDASGEVPSRMLRQDSKLASRSASHRHERSYRLFRWHKIA